MVALNIHIQIVSVTFLSVTYYNIIIQLDLAAAYDRIRIFVHDVTHVKLFWKAEATDWPTDWLTDQQQQHSPRAPQKWSSAAKTTTAYIKYSW